jgi:hypothetical protein
VLAVEEHLRAILEEQKARGLASAETKQASKSPFGADPFTSSHGIGRSAASPKNGSTEIPKNTGPTSVAEVTHLVKKRKPGGTANWTEFTARRSGEIVAQDIAPLVGGRIISLRHN